MLDYFQITQTRRAGHCFSYWDTWSGSLIPHPSCIAGGLGLKIWLFSLDSGSWWDLCPARIPAEVHSLSTTVVSNSWEISWMNCACFVGEKAGHDTPHFEGWVPGIQPLISSTSTTLLFLFPENLLFLFYLNNLWRLHDNFMNSTEEAQRQLQANLHA